MGLAAHVEHAHRRQRTAVDAGGQAQARNAAIALGARSGAAEQQQRTAVACAARSHVAGVVAGVAFVLVGGVVLLVEHEQPESLDRREDGRAGTHADARLARAQPPPFVVALAGAQARVHHRHGVAEALDETPDDLRGEGDLGDEHDRPATLLERGGGGAQVDLGLARAGDAVQEPLRGASLAEREEQIVEDRLLLRDERRRPGAERADREMRGAAHGCTALAPAEPAGRARAAAPA